MCVCLDELCVQRLLFDRNISMTISWWCSPMIAVIWFNSQLVCFFHSIFFPTPIVRQNDSHIAHWLPAFDCKTMLIKIASVKIPPEKASVSSVCVCMWVSNSMCTVHTLKYHQKLHPIVSYCVMDTQKAIDKSKLNFQELIKTEILENYLHAMSQRWQDNMNPVASFWHAQYHAFDSLVSANIVT